VKEVYIISGASSPLGRTLTASLLARNIACLLIVRDKTKLLSLDDHDSSLWQIIEGDLSSIKFISDLCLLIERSKYVVRAFIHLAAQAPLDDFNADQLQTTFTVNVFSGWQIARACIEKMAISGGGRILFVGSVGHKFGGKPGRAGYSGSKFLLEFFPREFRTCAGQNILVNTLRLGVMKGGTQTMTGVDEKAFLSRVKLIPTGRAVTHNEAIRAIEFLCSTENQSIHNNVFMCTGGE